MIKSLVYGGMDGIITTFAIVCAASGAGKDNTTIVTMVSASDLSGGAFGPKSSFPRLMSPLVGCARRSST